jgi:hypothetical protein
MCPSRWPAGLGPGQVLRDFLIDCSRVDVWFGRWPIGSRHATPPPPPTLSSSREETRVKEKGAQPQEAGERDTRTSRGCLSGSGGTGHSMSDGGPGTCECLFCWPRCRCRCRRRCWRMLVDINNYVYHAERMGIMESPWS